MGRYDFQTPVPDENAVGGCSYTNVSANYDVNRKISLYLHGDHLLDGKYHEINRIFRILE